jgi:hypothetical protein
MMHSYLFASSFKLSRRLLLRVPLETVSLCRYWKLESVRKYAYIYINLHLNLVFNCARHITTSPNTH